MISKKDRTKLKQDESLSIVSFWVSITVFNSLITFHKTCVLSLHLGWLVLVDLQFLLLIPLFDSY